MLADRLQEFGSVNGLIKWTMLAERNNNLSLFNKQIFKLLAFASQNFIKIKNE